MSKGSKPRPIEIPMKKFDANWDAIFKKKETSIDELLNQSNVVGQKKPVDNEDKHK